MNFLKDNGCICRVIFLIIFCSPVFAVEKIDLVGLFGKKIVIVIDGKQQILKQGEVSAEGVKVIEVTSEYAVLEIDKQQAEYPFGKSSIGTAFKERKNQVVNIYKDRHGMYRTVGRINDMPVNFLVDTGASAVAINASMASRLGIDYRSGEKINVSTASTVVPAYRLKLDSVTVGAITLQNVEGVVLETGHEEILLGMSFLGRMKLEYEGTVMKIMSAY